jgi:hypothetical protein
LNEFKNKLYVSKLNQFFERYFSVYQIKINFMKKNLLFILLLVAGTAFAQISVPAPSPFTTVTQKIGLSDVTIKYSRPSVKGRKIYGDNVPFGKVWRTGANQISTINFEDQVVVNGTKVPAGSYGLYTIPNEKEWTVILNKDDKQWGAGNYKQELDVLRMTVKADKTPALVENFTISFSDFTPTTSNIVIAWENTSVKFGVEHLVHDKIMAEIAAKTADPKASVDTYFDAADYYYEKGIDLPKALEWATKVVDNDKQYWTYQLRARVAAKMGNCKVAVPDAEKSMELAKKAGDVSYIKKNEKVFADCKK